MTEPVWWTTDPAAAHAAAKVGVVYGGTSERLSWQIGEQVKPAIQEPREFGSIVRAGHRSQPTGTEFPLWQPAPNYGDHYWISEFRDVEVWSELTDVEVLRVGLGEVPSESQRAAQDDAYLVGIKDAASRLRKQFIQFASSAITSERKDAWRQAIQAVEELTP